jgi:hypothetical protein
VLASDVKNLAAYSKDMVNLGKVKDLESDRSKMIVTNIVAEFDKEAAKRVLGMKIVLRRARRRAPVA